jgi:hypothetical protein
MRWLGATGVVAVVYVTHLMSATITGSPTLPGPLNGAVQALLVLCAVITALSDMLERRHRSVLRRLEEIERRLSVLDAPTQPQPLPQPLPQLQPLPHLRAVGTAIVSPSLPADNVLAFELGRKAERAASRAHD